MDDLDRMIIRDRQKKMYKACLKSLYHELHIIDHHEKDSSNRLNQVIKEINLYEEELDRLV